MTWGVSIGMTLVLAMACHDGELHGTSRKTDGKKTESQGTKSAPAKSSKAAGEANDPATDESGETDASSDATSADDDLKALPPEVVSGAYLTCSTVVPTDRAPRPDVGYYGCATFDAAHKRLDVKHAKVGFDLTDTAGKVVPATPVTLADHTEDIIWEVAAATLVAGVSAQLNVYDDTGAKQSLIHEKKSPGSVTNCTAANDGPLSCDAPQVDGAAP